MVEWFRQLQEMLKTDTSLVLITVASVKGSTPREAGAKMLVSANRIGNSIGGGHLELKAIQIARNLLSGDLSNTFQRFSLGAGLGQCCGGVVTLFFEVVHRHSEWLQDVNELITQQQAFVQVIPLSQSSEDKRILITADSVSPLCTGNTVISRIAGGQLQTSDNTFIRHINGIDYVFDLVKADHFNVFLFGAGHVGEALITQLAQQPCAVNWVDTRDDQFPEKIPANVTVVNTDLPEAVVDDASPGSYFLVMTHDHSLDQKLAEQILKRDDFHYFGLIGSVTKRKKFEHRLSDCGINKKQLQKMTCPIGISGISSKRPAAIALAVAAELIQSYERVMSMAQDYATYTDNREFIQQ